MKQSNAFAQWVSKKKWSVLIAGFIIAQVAFIITDGTIVEPKLNNLGNFAKTWTTKLFFMEWISLYENLIYKLLTTLAILQLVYLAVRDITNHVREKQKSN